MSAAAACVAALASASPSVSASTAAAGAVRLSELLLQCGEGLQLAAQSYQSQQQRANEANIKHPPNHRRILCLHGWMDNCRSFHHLAPTLAQRLPSSHVVALDFPGHGWSGHKSVDGPPSVLAEAVYYVHEAVKELQWLKKSTDNNESGDSDDDDGTFCVIGHSMGAAIGCLYAAAFPEQVSQLVLLEGAGPFDRNPADTAKHVRLHVEKRQQQQRPPRVYESLQKAVQARCATARNFPGNQYLSEYAAREMVLRGTRTVTGGGGGSTTATDGNGVQFVHDPRLQWPSVQYFTIDQTEALYKNIQCPTALLTAEHGWPFDAEKLKRCTDLLQPQLFVPNLPGSHHFHADPETAPAVAEHVVQFLNKFS